MSANEKGKKGKTTTPTEGKNEKSDSKGGEKKSDKAGGGGEKATTNDTNGGGNGEKGNTTGTGGGGKKTKGGKGGGSGFDDASGAKSKNVSVLDVAAMENAYNICHNVQDLLYFRGFFWEGSSNKKGKGKGRKKGKKGK